MTYRLLKLLPRFIKGIRTKMTDTINILTRESYLSDSYIQEALKNSKLTVSQVQDRDDEDTFYFLFENLFRGSIEEIKRRQSIYLPCVTEAHANSKGLFFLDVGCGRGEFLDLLKGHGIPAKGVDLNRIATHLAKEMDVDVVFSDALEYLKTLGDDSLIGVSMFQVIEHLDFKNINNILKTAFKKISLNGVIILESVNPYCSMALGRFYLDPTHIRPYPPDLMKFVLEWDRFEKVKIIYSSPILKRLPFKGAVRNYQDYAVVGRKMKL
jgi:O-antigen chain-terminating methyltransferase